VLPAKKKIPFKRCSGFVKNAGTMKNESAYTRKLKNVSGSRDAPQKLAAGEIDITEERNAIAINTKTANESGVFGSITLPVESTLISHKRNAAKIRIAARNCLFCATGNTVSGKNQIGVSAKRT
jgi:hypothetical protein